MAKSGPLNDRDLQAAAASLQFRWHVRFWLIVAALVVVFLLVFSSILLPFAAGMALAYFLDPVADRLERIGFSRLMATVVILVAFLVLLVLGLVLVVPLLATQVSDLVQRLPHLMTQLQTLITDFDPEWLHSTFGIDTNNLRQGLNSLITNGVSLLTTVFTSLWSSATALFSIAGLFVVTPVVAFYMLLDWDRMVAKVDSWVPRKHVETVRRLANEINQATAGFVRGQGTVCLLLGAMYSIGLSLVGLNFAVLVGMVAGIISFIPYVGSLVGLVVALGLAFVQFWPDWTMVAATAGVFAVGQFIEGNILQPRLVGKSVGLHPVWLMFALFAFGALFGFVGLVVAVPAAAAIAVLVRFAISKYIESPLYTGEEPELVDVTEISVVDAKPSRSPAKRKPATAK